MPIQHLNLTLESLAFAKKQLSQNFPKVKSSHRCEAFSRSLGCKTYASLLTKVSTSEYAKFMIHPDLFTNYLTEKGFQVQSKVYFQCVAQLAIFIVTLDFPRLTTWGMGVGQPRIKAGGNWENASDMVNRFRNDRQEIQEGQYWRAFLSCLALLENIPETKTIRNGTGSYRLKHIAENYPCVLPDGSRLGPTYVPNGLLIAAAVHAGFEFREFNDGLGYSNVNVSFNMSKKLIDELDFTYRPNSGFAQDRRRKKASQISSMKGFELQ